MNKNLRMGIWLALMLALFSIQATATLPFDREQPVTLTIQYEDYDEGEQTSVGATEFDLYFVADVNDTCDSFALSEEFAPYTDVITNLDQIENLNAGEQSQLASDLKIVAQADDLQKCDAGTTDETGKLQFPTTAEGSLKPGLYLVVGHNYTYNGYIYVPMPSLIVLPGTDDATREWNYHVTANIKYSRYPLDKDGSIKVTKFWADEKDSSRRPAEVTVNLCVGNKIFASAKLNAENNWTYVWSVPQESADWYISENAVENYTYSVKRTENTFVVTNTLHKDPEKDPPDDSDEEKLPQTGVLWWPVPCAAGLGIFFLVVGLELRKKNGRSHEEHL